MRDDKARCENCDSKVDTITIGEGRSLFHGSPGLLIRPYYCTEDCLIISIATQSGQVKQKMGVFCVFGVLLLTFQAICATVTLK